MRTGPVTVSQVCRQMPEPECQRLFWPLLSTRTASTLCGAGFLNAYNGVPVNAVNQSAGHYAIPDAPAPSDYGYNKIKRDVVVRDSAIVQGGANLSGSLVLGGDAEMWITCSSGTYLTFNPDRGCDGRGGESDVNPSYGAFTDQELAITI